MPTQFSKRLFGTVRFAFLAILLSTLAGCFIPENFTAKVTVAADGSAIFDYRGNLAFAPALRAAAQGQLTPEDEAELAKMEDELKREPGFQSVNYLGKGRCKVHFRKEIPAGTEFFFISEEVTRYFTVRTAQIFDGRQALFITSEIEIDDETRRSAGPLFDNVRGVLTAKVPRTFEIIESNGKNTTGPVSNLFGWARTFRWQITPETREKPRLVVAMAK